MKFTTGQTFETPGGKIQILRLLEDDQVRVRFYNVEGTAHADNNFTRKFVERVIRKYNKITE